MTNKEIIKLVEENIVDYLNENHLELFDVEYVKEGSNFYLRVYIDKEGSVTINDCEIVTRYLSKVLDKLDPISHQYVLEVSSPGLFRQLKKKEDYKKSIDKNVFIKLYKEYHGKKEFTANIIALNDDILTIQTDDAIHNFNLKDIALCKLTAEF